MAERVYECDQAEVKQVKKALTYDPYLDPNLIPKVPELDDKAAAKLSKEELEEFKRKEQAAEEAAKKLRADKFANVIFARQTCDFREGKSVGIENDKYYLYIKAPDDFFAAAEERFKAQFPGVKRAAPADEEKFIKLKHEEESKANAGFGLIFGA